MGSWLCIVTYLGRFPPSNSKRRILCSLDNGAKRRLAGQLQMSFLRLGKGFCVWSGYGTNLREWGAQQWLYGLPVVLEFDVNEGHGKWIFDPDQRKDSMVGLNLERLVLSQLAQILHR